MFLIPRSSYVVRTAKGKGRGVFAARDIPNGAVIGDYSGKIVRSDDEDELRDGLYTMLGGERFDILANPKEEGVHIINHSCANNCDIYPYRGHMLFVTSRKIFAGEEITVNYLIGKADKSEKNIPCYLHTCHCGSRICTGSMHDNEVNSDQWTRLMKKEYGALYKKVPGKYGDRTKPLPRYPGSINIDSQTLYPYNVFGSEHKAALRCGDATLPPLDQIRKKIRTGGRRLFFSKLHLEVYGVRGGFILAERK